MKYDRGVAEAQKRLVKRLVTSKSSKQEATTSLNHCGEVRVARVGGALGGGLATGGVAPRSIQRDRSPW